MYKIISWLTLKLVPGLALLRERASTDTPLLSVDFLFYGLTVILLNLPKFIILVLLSSALDLLGLTLLIFILYGFLRQWSKGIHFGSSLACMAFGLLIYIGGAAASTYIPMPRITYLLTGCTSIMFNIKYCPFVSGEARDSLSMRRNKNVSVALVILYLTVSIFIPNKGVSNAFLVVLIAQTASILPAWKKVVPLDYQQRNKILIQQKISAINTAISSKSGAQLLSSITMCVIFIASITVFMTLEPWWANKPINLSAVNKKNIKELAHELKLVI